MLFLADTGARIGEASALTWDDVDLESGTARIWRSFSSDTALGPTKTGRERIVELSMRLIRVLAEAQPHVFPIPADSLVFAAQRGGFLRAANFRERVFKKLVAKALGPNRHLSPHSLRHTWASLHMARGTPLKWIQQQGGWTTAKVLLDTYGHFMPSESRGYANVIGGADGSQTAPDGEEDLASWVSDVQPSGTYQDSDRSPSPTHPRSPIMHSSTSRTRRHPVLLVTNLNESLPVAPRRRNSPRDAELARPQRSGGSTLASRAGHQGQGRWDRARDWGACRGYPSHPSS